MTSERNNHIPPTADEGRTLAEIISDVAEQELAQYPPVSMTPEKLKAMAADRKAARKKRRYKLAGGIAAMLALALAGVLIAFNALSVDVGADKNQKEEIKTEDGVVIEDGGYGASEDADGVWIATDWDDIDTAKVLFPQLVVPEYIPEGYIFEKLTIEHFETGDSTSKYLFYNNEKNFVELDIFVPQDSEMSVEINGEYRIVPSTKGDVYIQENDNKIATVQMEDGIKVKIWSNIADEEIIKIVDNFRN